MLVASSTVCVLNLRLIVHLSRIVSSISLNSQSCESLLLSYELLNGLAGTLHSLTELVSYEN